MINYDDLVKLSQSSQLLTHDLRWSYDSLEDLNRSLNKFSLMTDHKEGIPRTSFKGVISFAYGGKVIFLAPNSIKFD